MRLEYQIATAFALDLLLGDPRWLPHPVRGIGWLAQRVERVCRALFGSGRAAGIVAVAIVVGSAGGISWGLIAAARMVHPVAADCLGILIIYTTIATRDLADHAARVYRALTLQDLPAARRAVAMIVGRDTAGLDGAEVSRAAVESVAESIVDGITGALFFAFLAGPAGAMAYRAVNTLDSMFGHKDERYLHFGWAAARLDDLANWLPARLTLPMMWCAAALVGSRPAQAMRISLRDAGKHASPNAGLPEAAMAGALAVQLGGVNFYDGEPLSTARMGDPGGELAAAHIRQAIRIMLITAMLFLLAGLLARVGIERLLNLGFAIGKEFI